MAEAPTQPSGSPLEPALDAALRDPAQRSQLNPLQIAQAFHALQQSGWTDVQITRTYSISEASIRQYRKLLRLPPNVQEYIRQNKLAYSHAREVAKLLDGHEDRIEEAVDRIFREGMSARQVESYIAGITGDGQGGRTGSQDRTQPYTQNNEVTRTVGPDGESVHTDSTDRTHRTQPYTQNNEVTHPEVTPSIERRTQEGGEYTLLRDTVNFLANILIFWGPKDRAGDLAERWVVYCRETGWLRVGLSIAAIGLAGYGGWHLTRHVMGAVSSFGFRVSGSNSQPGTRNPQLLLDGSLRITKHYYIAGHRMVLKWASLGPGYRYRVYWNSPDGRNIQPVDEVHDVATPGALVDMNPAWKKGFLTVTAIGPGEIESTPTAPVLFETTPVNRLNSVEPLPLTGVSSSELRVSGSEFSSPKPQNRNSKPETRNLALPKAPEELHATVITPDLIELSWRPVGPPAASLAGGGPGYRYNAY
jgi:hypothetical protein